MSWCLLFPQDLSILRGCQFSQTANEGFVAENNAVILSSPRSLLLPTTARLTGSFLSFPKSSRWLYPCSEWTRVSSLWGFMSSEASTLSVYTRPPGSAAMPWRGEKRGGEREREMREQESLPCAHSSVLISILSSPLLTHLLVTTAVSLTFLEKETHTSRCSVWGKMSGYYCCLIIYLFIFIFCLFSTGRVLLHVTKKLN